jgi:ribulose kinase
LLVRLYRDMLGADLVLSQTPEPVLLGAAMVASVAAGLYPDLFAALSGMAPQQTTLKADPSSAAVSAFAYSTYLKLFGVRNEIEAQARRMAAAASGAS